MGVYRLQKIISESGLLSRRKADLIIKDGRVTVNGKKATVGEKADPSIDDIKIDGSIIPKKLNHKVILLNKPLGIISSCADTHGRDTVISLVPSYLRKGLHPIGRLDSDSRGALLLTNNGELTLRLTHPKYAHTKSYLILVNGHPEKSVLNAWRKGVILEGKMTIPAKIELVDRMNSNTLLKVTLKEGRNRQIRKLADFFGHPVKDLQRIAISNIKLNDLQEGHWRELKYHEWTSIIN